MLLHHLLLMLLLLLLLSEDHGLGDCVGLGHEFWILENGLAHGMWVDISARRQERICADLTNPVTLVLGEGQLQRVRVCGQRQSHGWGTHRWNRTIL